jgi:hypothetical protein
MWAGVSLASNDVIREVAIPCSFSSFGMDARA